MKDLYKWLIIGGVGLVGLSMFSNKAVANVGNSVGSTTAQFTGGVVTGVGSCLFDTIWTNPYNWASNYQGYIPVIDDLAKLTTTFKNYVWW